MHMYNLLTSDILEVISYIPYGLLIGGFVVLCITLVQHIRNRRIQIGRLFVLGITIVYLVVLLQTAFFSREPGSRVGEIDWRILPDWQTNIWVRTYALENIIMFVPFGILIPWSVRMAKKFYICIPLAMMLSFGIETAQYITERGFCQLEDLIMNTIGTIVGYGVWTLIYNVVKSVRGEKNSEK